MKYLIDSNVLITSFYGGVLPSLALGLRSRYPSIGRSAAQASKWLEEWFIQGFRSGQLVGSDGLIRELKVKKDRVSQLLQALERQGLIQILSPTPNTFSYVADICQFVLNNFEVQQDDTFLRGEDPMFVALAKTHKATLVTLEKHTIPGYDRVKKKIVGPVRIPFVAWAFGVRCISLYQAFDELAGRTA
ncbi:MAG: DUF4411 family protein [Limnochordales bacterium]|nr:DUF4411 family protein [Limnochordales bacterium]